MNEVYSVKLYTNLFVYSCYDIDKHKLKQFVISLSRNDITEILDHLEEVENQIGFGNLCIDYYLLHTIIDARSYIGKQQSNTILQMLNRVKTSILNGEPINADKRYMNQLDLEPFWGLYSMTTKSSLSDVKIALNENDVTENVFYYGVPDEKIKDVLSESISDIRCIIRLYYISIGKGKNPNYSGVNLISAKYKLCEEVSMSGINYSPTSFAKLYFLKRYYKFGGKLTTQELISQSKTNSIRVDLRECIPFYAMYSATIFNSVVNHIMDSANNGKEQFNCSVSYHGIPLKFGMGGLHGCNYPGKYESDEDSFIVDIDIVSMYAAVALGLNIKPKHMEDAYLKAIKDIYEKRKFHLHDWNEVSQGVVKITKKILNYIYGKTKEVGSPFFDMMYSAKVTIAAQLFMARLMEALVNRIDDIKFIMVNTDSITFKAPRKSKQSIIDALEKIKEILPDVIFKIKTYKVLYVKDVNNYIGYNGEKVTARGLFDFNIDVLKDNSSMVIPKVLRDCLIFHEDVLSSIAKYDIDDFLIRAKNENQLSYHRFENNTYITSKIQNPSRYYYSKDYKTSGAIFVDRDKYSNRLTDSNAITLMNKKTSKHPDVNMQYYISKIQDVLFDVNKNPSSGILL